MAQDGRNGEGRIDRSVEQRTNTRREFLGATAGSGLAGAFWDPTGEYDAPTESSSRDGAEPSAATTASGQAGVFDIRDYGAVGDGETDCTDAIHQAIEDASEVAGTVLIPAGDWVSDWIILRHEHNGVTLQGVGNSSRIIPLQAVHPEEAWTWTAYGPDGIIDIDDTHFVFQIQLNDNFSPPDGTHPASLGEFDFNYREAKPFENITIRDLHLDGRKADLDDAGGRGITGADQQEEPSENIRVENVWAHDYNTTGIRLTMGQTTCRQVVCNDNGYSGITLGITEGASSQLLTNVIGHGNGTAGLKVGVNYVQMSNFLFTENGAESDHGGGILLSDAPRVIFTNGRLKHNQGHGIDVERGFLVTLDDVESTKNELSGYRLSAHGNFYLGNVAAIQDNQSGESSGMIEVLSPSGIMNVSADRIVASGTSGSGPGVVVEEGAEFRVSDLQSWFNEGPGLLQKGGRVVVQDGTVWKNSGSDVRIDGGERTVLQNVRAIESTDVGVEVAEAAANVTLQNLDLGNAPTPVKLPDDADVAIDNVRGYPTEDSGRAAFSGGGGQKRFTIEHGLATTPEQINVVADAASDAPAIAGVKDVTDTSFQVEFLQPTPSGFLDEKNVGVYWDANAY